MTFLVHERDGATDAGALDTKYHEGAKPEVAKARPLAPSGGGVRRRARPADVVEPWLEHLLALSMPQHSSGLWRWARYVVLHPAGNTDVADVCRRYATIDAGGLPPATTDAFGERYLPG